MNHELNCFIINPKIHSLFECHRYEENFKVKLSTPIKLSRLSFTL